MPHGSGGVGPLKALDYVPSFSGLDDESFPVWYNDICNIINVLDPRKVSPDVFDIALYNKLRGDAADLGRRVRSTIYNAHTPKHVDSIQAKEKIASEDKDKEKEEDPKPVLPFWSLFLEEFKKAYYSPAQAVKWFTKLDNLRQNGSDVVKYINLVVNFSYRVNQQVTEPEIIVRIIRGLDDHFRSRISATSFKTLEDVSIALSSIQAVDPPKSLVQSASTESHFIQPSSPTSRGSFRSPRYGHPGIRNSYNRHPVICHRCGVKGHIAPNCSDKNHSHHIHQADDVECEVEPNINTYI